MKKVLAYSLLFLFLLTNSGMAITMHWCGGKLASVKLLSTEIHHCKCGKKAMKPGCCKDKTTILKVQSDLSKAKLSTVKMAVPQINVFEGEQFIAVPLVQSQYALADFYHPPPYKPPVPLYLLDSVFLI